MTESPPPPARRPPITGVFRHRNYRLFFAGQLLSLMGSWMQTIGQAWLVYKLTGSPLALGLIGFLQQGPVFFFSVLGGTVADRVDRRRRVVVMVTGMSGVLRGHLGTFRMATGHLTYTPLG